MKVETSFLCIFPISNPLTLKFKLSFLLGVWLFFFIAADAQSLYVLKYHFYVKNGLENRHAFLLRNGNGTGFMRIASVDSTNAQNLVEVEMLESAEANSDTVAGAGRIAFVGREQRAILGNVSSKAPGILFLLNKETGFFEPSSVFFADEMAIKRTVPLDEVKLLQKEDLTKELVLQYFTRKEDFYINLFEAKQRGLNPRDQQQVQLHLVVVANTEDRTIGRSCIIDKDATQKLYGEVAGYLGIRFNAIVIAGKDFSKINVETAINSLKPAKEDIVVFYYSGHGFNDFKNSNTRYPFLDLRDKPSQKYGGKYTLNIESIYREIVKKGARMNLVFSDCCNNDPAQSSLASANASVTRGSRLEWSMDNCKTLFMDEKPLSMLMTGAAKGELSAGNPKDGGFFTYNFRESLEEAMRPFSNNISWPGLLTAAQKQTSEMAKRTICRQLDESFKKCEQNPVFNVE
jgi:Caspase domain